MTPFPKPAGISPEVWAGACALAAERHPQATYPQPSDVDDARTVVTALVACLDDLLAAKERVRG